MQPYKKRMFSLLAVLVAVLFALGVGELLLRVTGFEFNLHLSKIEYGWPDPVTMKQLYYADQDLLWVPQNYESVLQGWRAKKPAIVFMGCSCTESGKYVGYFRSIMKEDQTRPPASVINVGVSGWTTYQGLQQLKRDVLPLKPKIITVYYGWNDHWASFGVEDKDVGRFNRDHPGWLLKLNRLKLVQLFQSVFIRQYKTNTTELRPSRVSLADFKSNLRQITRMAADNGIVPVLITAPSSHVKGEEPQYLAERGLTDLNNLVPLHQEYVGAVREVAREEGVHLVDLAEEFDKLFQEYPLKRQLCFKNDGIHAAPEGDQIIADLIYDYFQRHDFFNPTVQ
jgi:lysophospholipase L1-like esterase